MTTPRLRIGQIGVGGFGGARRAFMRETGLFDLVASYDLNPEAMAAAQHDDGARPTASYAELLATPGLEAVVISTGAKFHAEQVVQAAARGLHVFVEKPLCSTSAEVDLILAAQRRHGVVIGCGHTDHAAEATARTIKKLLDSGALGTIAAVEATTCHTGGLVMPPDDWRGDPAKNPGGMLFQCGVHKLHELMFYFGPIARVFAAMRYEVHPATRTADTAQCVLFFKSGLTATLNAYHVCPYRHTLNLFGTKANLYRDSRYYHEGDILRTQTTQLDGKHEPQVPLVITEKDEPHGNLRNFYRAVRQGGQPYPSVLDGARAVEAVFAAEESARTGCVVKVRDLG